MTDDNLALKRAGLRITSPRLKILNLLNDPAYQHTTAEALYRKLLDMGEEMGLATVYRVLNQFDEAGIVVKHNFESGKAVFELANQKHHDHLICLDCGEVFEFRDEIIEQRQREIAHKNDLNLTNHSLYIYGHCASSACRKDLTPQTKK